MSFQVKNDFFLICTKSFFLFAIRLRSAGEIAGSSVHKLRQRSNERINSHADDLSRRTETVRTIQLRLGLVRVSVI